MASSFLLRLLVEPLLFTIDCVHYYGSETICGSFVDELVS